MNSFDETVGTVFALMIILAIFVGAVKLMVFLFGLQIALGIIIFSVVITFGSAFLKGSSKNSKQK